MQSPPPVTRTASAPRPMAVDTAGDEEEKPVGSVYTPVSLPAPKKLKNPFAAFEQQQVAAAPPLRSSVSAGGPKKLTWSERQALAKKQAEEEDTRSRSASYVSPALAPGVSKTFTSSAPTFGRAAVSKATPRNFGAVGAVAAGAAVGVGSSLFTQSTSDSAGFEVEEQPVATVRIAAKPFIHAMTNLVAVAAAAPSSAASGGGCRGRGTTTSAPATAATSPSHPSLATGT